MVTTQCSTRVFDPKKKTHDCFREWDWEGVEEEFCEDEGDLWRRKREECSSKKRKSSLKKRVGN